MLIDVQRSDVRELDASHEFVDVRMPTMRVSRVRSRRVASDFGLLRHALFLRHNPQRSGVTIVLEGQGRCEEDGRRAYFGPGELTINDHARGATEAYAGSPCSYVVVEWEAGVHGGALKREFAIERLSQREMARVRSIADQLDGARPARAVADIFDVLRAAGAPLDRIDPRALEEESDPTLQPLQIALSRALSSLHRLPTIDDLEGALGWNQRQIHRRILALSQRYRTQWAHWRKGVHRMRILRATQLLSVEGATTELVARLAGFRAPSALCHAFAKAGLPSPQRIAAAARRDVLARWSELCAG